MDYQAMSLELHEKHKGKINVVSKVKVETKEDLSIVHETSKICNEKLHKQLKVKL